MVQAKRDIDRLYLKHTVGGKGLILDEDCMRMEWFHLFFYNDFHSVQGQKATRGRGLQEQFMQTCKEDSG